MILAITITLGWWLIPTIISAVLVFFGIQGLVAANRSSSWMDFGGILEGFAGLLFLLAATVPWGIYFAVLYFTR
jgi:hypothetical protein